MKRKTGLTRALLLSALAVATITVFCRLGTTATPCVGCTGNPIGAYWPTCGTLTPPLDEQRKIEAVAASGGAGTTSIVTIPVYFHIVTNAAGEGGVSDAVCIQQIDIMNTGFSGAQSPGAFNTAYRFQLAGIDRSSNTAWYNAGVNTQDEIDMKTALHQGSADDMNVYVKLSDVGGYSTFPWAYPANPLQDGIVAPAVALPGDGMIHEAGHWLGLYHTFQGGCDTNNDYVTDTPAEKSPNRLCPPGNLDTCTGGQFKGKDPTNNFMDYTPDACRYQFTSGQSARMDVIYNAYRAGK